LIKHFNTVIFEFAMATAFELLSTIYELIQGGATVEEAVAYATTGNETDKEYEQLKDQAQQFFDNKNKDDQESKNNDPFAQHDPDIDQESKNNDPFAQHDPDIDDKPYKKRKRSFNNLPATKQAKVTDSFQKTMPMTRKNPEVFSRETDTSTDVEMSATRTSAAAETSNSATRYGQETPVTIPPTITYGLQDTHTTILPYTFYGCVGNLTFDVPTKLKIRCNSPYNCVENTFTSPTDSSTSIGINTLYSKFITSALSNRWVVPPVEISATTGEKPAYLNYWANYYDYYTVLGAEIHLVCQNPNTNALSDAMCVITMSGSQDPPDTATLNDTMYWKRKNMVLIESSNSATRPDHSATIIEKSWKPGQYKREVRDDSKAQTWIPINTLPTLDEHYNFWFYRAPLCVDTASVAVNFMCTVKYIVQFKDPKVQVHYPRLASTADPHNWAPVNTGSLS